MHCVLTKFTKFVCIITLGNHNTLIHNIIFTANIVAPVILIVALDYLSKRLNIINEYFVEVTSRFVFNDSLPVFIFLEIIHLDLSIAPEVDQIV
jgi:predicted permease